MRRLLALALLVCASTVAAEDIGFVVNTTQDGVDFTVGDGICSALPSTSPARCSLRAAMMEANATTIDKDALVEIRLTAGSTYALIDGAVEQESRKGDLDLLRPMRIGVPDTNTERATIVGPSDDRIFHLMQGAAGSQLVGLALTGGSAAGEGCAIYSAADAVLLDRVDVHDNCFPGSGHAVIEVVASMQLVDSEVRNNLVTSTVLAATGVGTELELSRSSVFSNAQKFAAIHVSNGAHLTLSQSTISQNSATSEGRAIVVSGASALIEDSTIVNNGGIELWMSDVTHVHVERSILWSLPLSSTCHDVGKNSITLRWNLHRDGGCVPDPTSFVDDDGSSLLDIGYGDATPKLSNLGYWGGLTRNHRLETGHLGIDRVPPEDCSNLPYDQRGKPRIVSHGGTLPARCDIGAVELEAVSPQDDPFAGRFADDFEGEATGT